MLYITSSHFRWRNPLTALLRPCLAGIGAAGFSIHSAVSAKYSADRGARCRALSGQQMAHDPVRVPAWKAVLHHRQTVDDDRQPNLQQPADLRPGNQE